MTSRITSLSKFILTGNAYSNYYFNDCEARLVPEPTNRHDKNAVMITLDGKCVGYVPANLCAQVKRLMKGFYDLTVQVRGGPSKVAYDGKVYRDKQEYHIYVTIAPKSSKKTKSPAKTKWEEGNIGGFFTKLLSAFNHKTE